MEALLWYKATNPQGWWTDSGKRTRRISFLLRALTSVRARSMSSLRLLHSFFSNGFFALM